MSVQLGIVKRSLVSPLASASTLKPRSGKMKKTVVATLLLTSLVDAFSILVLFLMMNSSNGAIPAEVGSVTLPQTTSGAGLTQKTTTVRYDGDQIFLDDQQISSRDLGSQLTAIFDKNEAEKVENFDSILFVADKELNYLKVNELINLATEAGYKTFKFAVSKN